MKKISNDLFERCCRASCTVNGLNPNEIIPGNAWGATENEEPQERWKWVAQICGNEIISTIQLTLDDVKDSSRVYVGELQRQRDRLLQKAVDAA
jgi:hypothetical protein